MFKYLIRFYNRYTGPVNAAVALATFVTIFHKPLNLILFESQQEDFLAKNPRQAQLRENFEKRKATIIKLNADISSCEDPEEKNRLKEQLRIIHLQRYQQYNTIAQATKPKLESQDE